MGNKIEKSNNTQYDEPSLFEILVADYQDFQPNINTRDIKLAIEHHIVTKGSPVKARVRRLSPEKLAFVEQEIDNFLTTTHMFLFLHLMPVLFILLISVNLEVLDGRIENLKNSTV